MPVKITCPHCGVKNALTEPLPLPGSQIQCVDCVARLAISYPPGVMDALKGRGKAFQDRITGFTPPPPKRRAPEQRRSAWLGFMGDPAPAEEPPEEEGLTAQEQADIADAQERAQRSATEAGGSQRRILSSLDAGRRLAGDQPSAAVQSQLDALIGWVDEAGNHADNARDALARTRTASSVEDASSAADDAATAAKQANALQHLAKRAIEQIRSGVAEQAEEQAEPTVEVSSADAAALQAAADAKAAADAERAEQLAQQERDRQAAQLEAERVQAEKQAEEERLAEQRKREEAERIEAERIEAERIEAERIEAERIEAERIEAERIEAERIEAALQAEQREREEAARAALAAQAERERIDAEQRAAERARQEEVERRQAEALERARQIQEEQERARQEAEAVAAIAARGQAAVDEATQATERIQEKLSGVEHAIEDAQASSSSVDFAVEQLVAALSDATAAVQGMDTAADSLSTTAEAETFARRADVARITALSAESRAETAALAAERAVAAVLEERDREAAGIAAAIEDAEAACASVDETTATVEKAVTDGRATAAIADAPAVRQALAQLVRTGTRVSQSQARAHEALERARAATDVSTARAASEDARREAYGAATAAELMDDATESLAEAVEQARAEQQVAQAELERRLAAIAQRASDAVDAASHSRSKLADLRLRIPVDAPQETHAAVDAAESAAADLAEVADKALQSAQDATSLDDAESALGRAEHCRDETVRHVNDAREAVDAAVEHVAAIQQQAVIAQRLTQARERAEHTATDAEERLAAAHERFAEWDDDADGERVRVALNGVAQAAADARTAADAAVLSTSPEEAEEHAAAASKSLSLTLEHLAEVARESTLAERARQDRIADEQARIARVQAEAAEEADRVARARDAEAERMAIAVEHAVASHSAIARTTADLSQLDAYAEEADDALQAVRHAQTAEEAEAAAEAIASILADAKHAAAEVRTQLEQQANQEEAAEHAHRAAAALEASTALVHALRREAGDPPHDGALTTAMARVDSALALVADAAQTAQTEASHAVSHPVESAFHVTGASLAATRADGAEHALRATVDAARDVLRLGQEAASERERAALAAARAEEEAATAAAAQQALEKAHAAMQVSAADADLRPLIQRLERARGRAEALGERAEALVAHIERTAAEHPAPAVTDALTAVHTAYDQLLERVDAAHAVVEPSEATATAAENAAADARELLADLESAGRDVSDAVRLQEDAAASEPQDSGPSVHDAIERARAAAEDAQQRVLALDQQIRADNVSAPGALDAFANASRAADAAAAAAERAAHMTSAEDAAVAAMDAADAASVVRAEAEAANAAIAMEVGGREHDMAALSRVRAAAQQAAHSARIHAQQASRIARSVEQETVDDNEAVAQARTRVAELAAQVAFAAERADFACSEAEQTTDLTIATAAQGAADDAAREAEGALLSLESADDALADIIGDGLSPIPTQRPAPQGVSATITPTPNRADRVDAAPVDPSPIVIPPSVAPAPAPASTARPTPQPAASAPPPVVPPAPPKKKGRLRRIFGGMFMLLLVGTIVLLIAGGIGGYFGYNHYAAELPTVDALQTYRPPTVTTVYDHEGELLGEIYEERRYVTELADMPEHLQQAFTSSEDKAFWEHGGVNWIGLVRAMSVLITTGEKSQGASTITMQVTRNFLLTRDKTYERKIKEIILAQRIEDVYDKERILYLYLNELYLGSGAYGVEAAARTYFGKHVGELTLAESAMIAGLAPAPSTYSPHQNFDKAKVRQGYVLGRMLEDGHISQSEHDAALAEPMVIVERSNEFLEKSPYFTEHVRRHIVETYGHDRVYNEGLSVTTTCDLDLQEVAQAAVRKGVDEVDQRMGFRRVGLENISQAQIPERTAALETEMIDAWVAMHDPSGQQPRPTVSTLEEGELYTGVLTEVTRNHATVKIGSHEGIIPIAWSRWVFKPDHTRSWRSRSQNDLTQEITWELPLPEDAPEGAEPETRTGSILQVGDVVLVKVMALSTQDEEVKSDFRNTPGADASYVAAHLWQRNEVDAALLSYDLDTGAVRAMVGGADFGDSEFNRATQAMRQVGSTFKPIVYAAAIESKRVTAATMVTDGPLAFATGADFIWKPGNYSNSYLGNMTLRKALAMSRNTCTIRVLDRVDPGMNDDIVYDFVRRLGIGGPPTHTLPEDWVPTPDNDHACPWIREEPDFTVCADRYPPLPEGLTDREHRAQLTEDSDYRCRACDLSMGLGSRSLTMEELMRAYSTFATGGTMIEPYYIEEVRDRDGNVLESHADVEHVQVLDPAVAYITTWLMEGVVQGGTAGRAARLGLHLAGKTGTTNDEKDMWFIGYNPEVITSVYVGYDQPRSLGVSSTGGRTALPIWMEYMAAAVPPERDYPFPVTGDIEWANIEESTGRRVTNGGRRFPFLRGTVPESTGISAGQVSIDDIQTEL